MSILEHWWTLMEAVAHQPVAAIQHTELLLSHPAAEIFHLWRASGGPAHVEILVGGSKGERGWYS